jgi:ribosome production factor 2
VFLNKKNDNIHPFENAESLEFLAGKNECGLIMWGSHSKKRPNAVTILRVFDGRLLDIVELLLVAHDNDNKLQVGIGMKPMILFAGSMWEDSSQEIYTTLKSLFLDVFSGEEVKTMDVEGLQYLLMIAGDEKTVFLRWCKIRTRRSGQKVPRVELDEVGPKFDFRLGRFREAEASVMKEALKRAKNPNEARPKKNVETDLVGDKVGRVHLGRQDLSMLQTRKMKGLKRAAVESGEDVEMGEADFDKMSEEDEVVFKRPRVD